MLTLSIAYIQSVNGCNCGFYYLSSELSRLKIPLLFQYKIVQRRNYSIGILAGLEISYVLNYRTEYSSYYKRSNGTIDLGPYEYKENNKYKENNDFLSVFRREIACSFIRKLNKNIYFTTNLALIYSYKKINPNPIAIGLGFGVR